MLDPLVSAQIRSRLPGVTSLNPLNLSEDPVIEELISVVSHLLPDRVTFVTCEDGIPGHFALRDPEALTATILIHRQYRQLARVIEVPLSGRYASDVSEPLAEQILLRTAAHFLLNFGKFDQALATLIHSRTSPTGATDRYFVDEPPIPAKEGWPQSADEVISRTAGLAHELGHVVRSKPAEALAGLVDEELMRDIRKSLLSWIWGDQAELVIFSSEAPGGRGSLNDLTEEIAADLLGLGATLACAEVFSSTFPEKSDPVTSVIAYLNELRYLTAIEHVKIWVGWYGRSKDLDGAAPASLEFAQNVRWNALARLLVREKTRAGLADLIPSCNPGLARLDPDALSNAVPRSLVGADRAGDGLGRARDYLLAPGMEEVPGLEAYVRLVLDHPRARPELRDFVRAARQRGIDVPVLNWFEALSRGEVDERTFTDG